jgi:hypothetical protein
LEHEQNRLSHLDSRAFTSIVPDRIYGTPHAMHNEMDLSGVHIFALTLCGKNGYEAVWCLANIGSPRDKKLYLVGSCLNNAPVR